MKSISIRIFLLFLLFAVQLAADGKEASAQDVAPRKVVLNDGVTLHYIERGEGEPIIFVHGLGSDFSFWKRQLDGFARNGYRAIAYSRRYNYPNNNKRQPNHSAVVEADDLAKFIGEMKIGKAHVVGFSYGAYTSLILALKHPQLVKSVTLAEPPVASWLSSLPDDQLEQGKAHLAKLMNEGIKPAKAAVEAGRDEVAMRTMYDCIGGKGLFDRLPDFVRMKCRQNIEELKAIVTSNDPYPDVDREQVRNCSVPTLILSGSNSIATAKLTDPELERLLPQQSRKRVALQGATHIMWVEEPVQCRNAVLKFIRKE